MQTNRHENVLQKKKKKKREELAAVFYLIRFSGDLKINAEQRNLDALVRVSYTVVTKFENRAA